MPPPDAEEAAPDDVPEAVRKDVEDALNEHHGSALDEGERIVVAARHGDQAAWVRARVGDDRRAHEMELCAVDIAGDLLDGALGVLVDWLDGALDEWLAHDREAWVGVAWQPRDLEGDTLWVRGEVRDFGAESLADEWLDKNG